MEAAAGAEKWAVVDAGEFDAFEHAVETLIGTAGRGPEAIEGIENGGGSGFEERKGWEPCRLDLELESSSRVLKSVVGRVVGTEFGIEVTENADPNGVAHKGHSKLAVLSCY